MTGADSALLETHITTSYNDRDKRGVKIKISVESSNSYSDTIVCKRLNSATDHLRRVW